MDVSSCDALLNQCHTGFPGPNKLTPVPLQLQLISIRRVNILGFSVLFLKWANVKDTIYSTHSVINVLHTLQITVGGILMLKNSDTEAPEDLIEPLKGDLKEMY